MQFNQCQYVKISLLTAAMCFANMGFAQNNTTDENGIERIVIQATRSEHPISTVPNTIAVIDQEAISRQLAIAPDLSSLLASLVPGFSPTRQKLSGAGETLRGREPLYLIDGVPQSNPLRNGSRDGHTIDPFLIERIEIIKGANAIQGLGASGGIINIVTKRAQDARHTVQMGVNTSDEFDGDTSGFNLGYLFTAASDTTEIVLGATVRDNGMFIDGNGDFVGVDSTQGDIMDAQSVDLFAKLTTQIATEQRISFMVNRFDFEGNGDFSGVRGDADQGIVATSIKQPIQGQPAKNEVTTASVDYQHGNIAGGQLTLQLFYQDFSSLFGGGVFGVFQDPAFGPDLFDQSENQSEKFGFRSTFSQQNIAQTQVDLVVGLDYLSDSTFQSLAATGRKWVPETDFTNVAPFAQLRYSGIENLTLAAGVRYEDAELDVDTFTTLAGYDSITVSGGSPSFDETLFNVGAVYQFSPTFRAFVSFNEGYSMPDVGRVLRGINQPTSGVETFLDLQPIVSDNQELGIEYSANDLTMNASYFTSDSDFGSRLQADADGIFSVQRERTEIDGVEVTARYYWNASQFGVQYTKTNGEFDSDDDGRVDTDLDGANIPPERFNVSWSQQWNSALSSWLQANIFRDTNFSDSADFSGYTTFDATLSYTLNEAVVALGIENLTDKQFVTYYSQTNPRDNRYFAGRGRTFSLTYTQTF
ncbi:TonB-dependent receptor [Alteromonas oceanisediminis]|uniref:TonB-dependent receptor n=1 Tax=Alteromonas oceanisediminis TaxID=2836180 RepID=UPI001BDA8202|nr:TonB-dependent receptor [Alteromonas oceanisediminis]MBT0585771.1 TonB-dependent receptor [Alteromonas oceanisediminis]